MSKLCLMAKNALKSKVSPLNPTRILPSFRSFSTEGGEQPPPPPPPQQDSSSSADLFLQSPEGSVFGRLTISTKNMLKTDIIHYFEGCNLSPTDVKVEYNRIYNPVSMMVQFPSQTDYDSAFRQTVRKGRHLEKVNRSQWELLPSYDGKSVLLLGFPRNALPEDVEHFLAGTSYDPNFQIDTSYDRNFQIASRAFGQNEFIRYALVQFPSPIDALSVFLTKNNSFCLNNPVTMRVLQ